MGRVVDDEIIGRRNEFGVEGVMPISAFSRAVRMSLSWRTWAASTAWLPTVAPQRGLTDGSIVVDTAIAPGITSEAAEEGFSRYVGVLMEVMVDGGGGTGPRPGWFTDLPRRGGFSLRSCLVGGLSR